MGRQIVVRVAAMVPYGRVHIDESPRALQGKTEYTKLTVDSDSQLDLAFLRQVYCAMANIADPSVASRRTPDALKAFAAWWNEHAMFVPDQNKSWGELGVRNDDLLVLVPEPPREETRPLVEVVIRQIEGIEQDHERTALAEAISQSVQAAIGPAVREHATLVPRRVFIAMPMDEAGRPEYADVLDCLKAVCGELELTALRVDDVQTNARISDTIRGLLESSEYVIADLTDERPNVFFEAGYSEGIGKTPIYIARTGTSIHFDVKDYPVIFYPNLRCLKERVRTRLVALRAGR